jgi:hypothetical protein
MCSPIAPLVPLLEELLHALPPTTTTINISSFSIESKSVLQFRTPHSLTKSVSTGMHYQMPVSVCPLKK